MDEVCLSSDQRRNRVGAPGACSGTYATSL